MQGGGEYLIFVILHTGAYGIMAREGVSLTKMSVVSTLA